MRHPSLHRATPRFTWADTRRRAAHWAAALITAEAKGAELESFHAALVPDTSELIRWNIRDFGFDMVLSGKVPAAIRSGLAAASTDILGNHAVGDIDLWAVHPGGKTILAAVEGAFDLAPAALATSRGVLHDYGNMSSGTVMFVLDRLMRAKRPVPLAERGQRPRRSARTQPV